MSVTGVVTVDGSPAEDLYVIFKPVADNGIEPGPRSAGYTDAEGRYRLVTLNGVARQGAVVGRHQVSVFGAESIEQMTQWQPQPDGEGGTLGPARTPPTVTVSAEATPVAFEVPAGGTAAADFSL
ncbi:MAG: hypothetical protein AAF532_11710 [Planctomycetota bacterium]